MSASRTRKGRRALTAMNRAALGLWIAFSIVPVYWLLHMAFQSSIDATATPPHWLWFLHPDASAFEGALQTGVSQTAPSSPSVSSYWRP